MKKFTFPLDRVLSWRQSKVRLEEAKLAQMNGALLTLQRRITALVQSVSDAQTKFLGIQSAFSPEIGALEHFRTSAFAQAQHLQRDARALEAKIAHQAQVLVGLRRDAQLLERLREQRLAQWQKVVAKEVEQQAEESYLARFSRQAGMQS